MSGHGQESSEPNRLILPSFGKPGRNMDHFYKMFFQKSAQAIYLLDFKTKRILGTNPAFRRFLGYSEEEIQSLQVYDFVENEPKAVDLYLAQAVNDSEIDLGRRRWRRKDGSWIDVDVSMSWVAGATGGIFFVTGRDITDQVEAEQRLLKSEARYRLLIEHMNDGLNFVDNEEKIRFVNDKFCEITGYERHELIGQVASELLLDEEGIEYIRQVMSEREQGISGSYELQIITKSGEKIWVENNGSPFYDETGELVGSIGILRDIRVQKRAQEELKMKNRELDTFVYKASHDLKAPLASLKGLLQIAAGEIDDPVAMTYLDLVKKTSNKMEQVITGLLEITVIKQGKANYSLVFLGDVLDGIIEGLGHSPEFQEVEFRLEMDDSLNFLSDKNLLHSIFQNLIFNAVKYHRADDQPKHVTVKAEQRKDKIYIDIIDDGPGIPAKVHDKLFDMFFRASNDSKGTGLGLYIVKNACDKLGGRISLNSKVGVGTTFSIVLPVVSAESVIEA